jgi:LPXTG-motif cell wall-anchored protein
MRKLLYVLTAGALLILGAGTANAAYNEVTGSVTAGGTAVAGTAQTFSAGGFKVGSLVTFVLHSDPVTLGTATADSNGTATGTFTIPANTPVGTHTVTAQGVDPAGNARVVTSGSFTVVAAAAVNNGAPARTGASNTVPLTSAGAGLVLAGGALVVVAQRRRSAAAATT